MNNSYYETLDENFTQALNLYESKFTHKELIKILKDGNIVQKQIAAIRLDCVENSDEAAVLLDNLTGQDGKVREAVSLRLCEFMSSDKMIDYFRQPEFCGIFSDAVIDINANICRNVINAISNLKSDSEFCKCFCTGLSELTFNLLDTMENFDFQQGKYKVNKELFKLYWCLEAVYVFYDRLVFEQLKEIVSRAAKIPEYTIREKAAKILMQKLDDDELSTLRGLLQNDENYYVRVVFERFKSQL